MLDLLILAIAPAIFIFLYIYAKDRYEPEPLHLVIGIFFLGCLSTIPAMLIEYPFPDGVFASAVVAPVVEESCKFLVVFLFIYRNVEFDEPMDGIVYAMAAALGFATVENILYVIEGGMFVGIMRAFLSVPGHVIFSCIWGAALGIAKFRPASQRTGIILTGLLGAIFLHGLFNFSIDALDILGVLIILILVPTGIWWTCRNIRCAHADPASSCFTMRLAETRGAISAGTILPQQGIGGSDNDGRESPLLPKHFCTNCGAEIRAGTKFCEMCGKEI